MESILVTDSLFVPIGGPDERRLFEAGYDVYRLDVPKADEAVLIEHVAGKVGYLLGGVETVTDEVIRAADKLRAISFTGSGFEEFVPAWRAATSSGIAISAAKGANAEAVADWALVAGLSLVRRIPELTHPEGPTFVTTREFSSLTLGIVGYGSVGRALARKAMALGVKVIVAGPSGDESVEETLLEELLERADIVSVHVSKARGQLVIDSAGVAALKLGAILVNAAFEGAVDDEALLRRVRQGEVRVAVDYPLPAGDAPVGALIASNAQAAFNTSESNARVSERATSALLNLLSTGDDKDLVNPEYRDFRS